MLLGTLGLSVAMVRQTSDLGNKVRITEMIVDGNVRTLSQVQRELLRLDGLLSGPRPTGHQVTVQRSLVDQRIREGTVSYRGQTIGAGRLIDQAHELARRWRTKVRPEVSASLARGAGGRVASINARREIASLEVAFNELVSDSEVNRKLEAHQANSEAKAMLSRAHRLLAGLLISFVTLLLGLVLGGIAYVRFHRQRERASRGLEELNQELLRHSHVVRSTDNIVVVADAEGNIEWVNTAFERATGVTHEQVQRRGALDLLEAAGASSWTIDQIRSGLSVGGEGFKDDVVLSLPDGKDLWLYVDASPVHDERGELTGFVVVGSDVTDRRRAEQLVVAAKESAEEIAREKATFLASMSHEIRTPLNAVLGLTDLLMLTDLDDDQREYVRTAHSSGRLLLALVNDILDFSALDSGRVALEQRPFELGELLRDSASMFVTEARRRGVRLGLHVAPNLPTHVLGDETRLRQLVVNLLGNGLKFTEYGAVTLSASLSNSAQGAERDDEVRVLLTVTDTGIGIPEDRVARLFQPFTQGDATTTRQYGGTGLGLAICRLVAEQMNGSIEVRSEVGEGSTFVVELGFGKAASGIDIPAEVAAGVHVEVDPQLRVLLAEDDKVNQTVAVHMLRRLGIVPTVVRDGLAAVETATAHDFDVILMDIHMPTMDGVEATARLRQTLPAARQPLIVAMTANALDGDRERFLDSGMDGYISKPFTLADLSEGLSIARPRALAR